MLLLNAPLEDMFGIKAWCKQAEDHMDKSVTPDSPRQAILFRELKAPKEAFRYIRNFLAGQFVGSTRDDILLEEVLKCLFCKLYVEIGAAKPFPENADFVDLGKHVKGLFSKVRRDFPDLY